MRNLFSKQMEQLHVELIEMGALCEQAISRAYQVLMEEDPKAAQELRKKDAAIDSKEREIESICLKLLLQQQPVASDLRQVSAALKMITDMERIGDQASDIAEIVQTTHLKAPSEKIKIKEMAQITQRMVSKSVDAYVKQDLTIARQVIQEDDLVDKLFDEVKQELVQSLQNGTSSEEQSLDYLMIAKYYERIGDHATNIAEWVDFSVTGQHEGE
ncbi:MAG TPA: phosphate signaling complex protein PhoU [Candidatus Fusicatenibacter intestinigallinarum]|uniref:Phosphate-specific transport system accessory protein PhoU n=1 Tax=Candidatus Fusicatenibacter intestinigallinarum TaxID=2838598 RepID=A0A9D2NCX2_9FIRM|nr:phosphate signaling complex protein PhoU [Candidatus Fusicatenibacter intestinigallinarum]